MPGPWDRYAQENQQGAVFEDPNQLQRNLREQAEYERILAENDRLARQAQEQQREQHQQTERMSRNDLNSRMATGNVLQAIRNARRLATQGGTGFESLMARIPTTTARALDSELDPIRANLSFDRLQQMRDASETGGALGNVTERELAMLQATVASLDTGVDLPTFLDRLDRIERHFMGAQIAMAGVDPQSEEGRALFRDFGYTGVFDGENEGRQGALANPNATEEAQDFPQELQDLHLRYLRDNWGNIDTADYTRFRAALDEQAGFEPNLAAYRDAVPQWNAFAAEGGRPESMGQISAPNRQMGAVEQFINRSAQSPGGAFAANFTNAATAGVPGLLSGNQEGLEQLREARPYSSFAGELAGGIVGTKGVTSAGRLAGMNGLASDVAFNSVYGATQDTENPFRGAAIGGVSSGIGSTLGSRIGGEFYDTFAPGATRQANESVPSIQDLKDLANEQYADVQARGVAANADQTQQLAERFDAILRREGRITPASREIDVDTPVTRARMLVGDFAGQEMTPIQAQRVREVIGEGMVNGDPAQRRLSGMLVDAFDDWAEPVIPGIATPRETSRRYIQGQRIDRAQQQAEAGSSLFTRSGQENATRNAFRGLDRGIINGTENFDPEVARQIAQVNRGTATSNFLRNAGKFAPSSPMSLATGGGLGFGAVQTATGDPVLAGLGAGAVMGGGLFARKAATDMTLRDAEVAKLLALGGEEYRAALNAAIEQARRASGSFTGGLFGNAATQYSRPSTLRGNSTF